MNTDAISSMVLQDKKIAEVIINVVRNATDKDKTKSSDIKLSTSETQYSLKNWNRGRNVIGDFKGFALKRIPYTELSHNATSKMESTTETDTMVQCLTPVS